MSQVVHDKYSQMVKVGEEYIPVAIIDAQTRDGNDELIVGSTPMQWDDNAGLFLPTHKDNPLEARVRHLEELIGGAVENPTQYTLAARIKRIEDMLESGDAKMQLSGSTVTIGEDAFEFDPPRTIYGLADDKPDPAAAHAVVPFAYYVSVDMQTIEQTDGTQWVEV